MLISCSEKWLSVVKRGQDEKLSDAYADMEDALNRFQSAATIVTMVNTQEIKGHTEEIRSTTQDLKGDTSEIKLTAEGLKGQTSEIQATTQELKGTADQTLLVATSVQDNVGGIKMDIAGVRQDNAALLRSFQAQHVKLSKFIDGFNSAPNQVPTMSSKDPGVKKQSPSSKEPAAKKLASLARVRQNFNIGGTGRATVKAQIQDIKESFVARTCGWIEEEDSYKSWVDGSAPFLWICGGPGFGKSSLAYATAETLKKSHEGHSRTTVASFYFKEDFDNLRGVRYALCSSVIQIAEHDPIYCEQIAAEIEKDSNRWEDDVLWARCFGTRFNSKTESHLYLILDGIDELKEDERETLLNLLPKVTAESLNIHVLLTCRSDIQPALEQFYPATVWVTKDKILDDMQRIIEARIKALPRLRKFTQHTKRRIVNKLKFGSDGACRIHCEGNVSELT